MAKGTSFADKSNKKKKINQTFVKYVKSIKSEKTGHWRFNEQMVGLKSGENLDGAIKRLEEESFALDLDLSNMETATEETVEAKNEQVDTEVAVVADDVEETVELTEEKKEVSLEETPSEEQVAESPSEGAPAKAEEEKAAILEPDEEESTEEATKEEKAPIDATEDLSNEDKKEQS